MIKNDEDNAGSRGRRRNGKHAEPVITDRGMETLRCKFSRTEMSDARGITRARLLSRFVGDLVHKKFGGIILSYEGVLHDADAGHTMPLKEISSELERIQDDGIVVGIVSRGNPASVNSELKHAVNSKYHESTHVGYENGALTLTLDEDVDTTYENHAMPRYSGKTGAIVDKDIESFVGNLTSHGIIYDDTCIFAYPHQTSIKNSSQMNGASDIMRKAESVGIEMPNGIKIFDAGMFTDIISGKTSKISMVNVVKNHIPKDMHILCIGASGQWPGSDCELLTHRYSLSTGAVSATAASCWNLLAPGMQAERGTLEYLRCITTGGGWFSMKM